MFRAMRHQRTPFGTVGATAASGRLTTGNCRAGGNLGDVFRHPPRMTQIPVGWDALAEISWIWAKSALRMILGIEISGLNQLTKKKYLNKRQGESTPARCGKIRMYYTLTDSGRLALKDAYESNLKLWSGVHKYVFDTKSK